MKIGTCKARRGALTWGRLPVATDSDVGPISIPIAIAQGYEDGKTMFVSAGVHGDELNGIAVGSLLRQIQKRFSMKGAIVYGFGVQKCLMRHWHWKSESGLRDPYDPVGGNRNQIREARS